MSTEGIVQGSQEMHYESYEERKKYIFRQLRQVLLIGFAYYVVSSVTGLYILCPFRLITGLKCPGCGVTHYCLAMLHGNVHEAYEANQLLFFLIPILLLYGIWRAFIYIKKGRTGISPFETAALLITLIITISFGVFRNM